MITVAILGAGIGAEHLRAYLNLPDAFHVRMIVDQNIDRARALSTTAQAVPVTEISDALSDPSIDLIDICLPPSLHVPVAEQALAAGKHVICEKPLATSLAQAHRLAAAATAAERRVFPVFQYRWGRALDQLRWLIEKGLTGQPLAAALETHWARDATYYANGWRGTWEIEQGGAVLCHAIHVHDLLLQILGPVAEVSARVATLANPIETEDTAAILFTLQNGALATSSICLGAARDETRLRFVFENLMATSDSFPYSPGESVWRFEARNPENQSAIDKALAEAPIDRPGFEGFLHAVDRDLREAKDTAVSLADGVASIELVTAIYHSARTGGPAKLPIPENHPCYDGWQPQASGSPIE